MYFNIIQLSPQGPCHLELKIKRSTLGQLWSTRAAKVNFSIFLTHWLVQIFLIDSFGHL